MVSSRGCPYRCNWCAKPIYGNNYHVRSPKSIATEMLYLKTTLRPDRIWFADDIFALSPSGPTPWLMPSSDSALRFHSKCSRAAI